jgi:hypothetical protein
MQPVHLHWQNQYGQQQGQQQQQQQNPAMTVKKLP